MKRIQAYLLISIMYGILTGLYAQTPVGTGQTYSSLRTAFNAINNGVLRGNIVLRVTSNITETSSAVLNANGTGSASYSSVTIYPASSGLTITGNFNSPLIDFSGADNVVLDGRINGTGTANSLSLVNSSTNASSSTIRFINSASSNTIRYCIIKGSTTSTSAGIIFFSSSASGSGNDNNSITYNMITSNGSNRPVNVIYSLGTSGRENSGNLINNNEIYNFLRVSSASQAISLSSYTSDFTIESNSFYESTSLAPSSSVEFAVIRINNTTGNNFLIRNNFIGGTDAQCTGTSWTKSGARNNIFYGIYLSAGTTVASSIQGNIIEKFDWTNSGSGSWTAIYIAGGNAEVGNLSGNIIGESSVTGSVYLQAQSTGSSLNGIYIASAGIVTVQNNTISSFTADNSNSNYSTSIYGIYKASVAGNTIISNNTIGDVSTPNSLQAISSSTSNAQYTVGIYNAGTGTITISGNIIQNLSNFSTGSGTSSRTRGIYSVAGINSVLDNMVNNLSAASGQSTTTDAAALIGISVQSTLAGQNIDGNTVNNLLSTNPSDKTDLYGIRYYGPASGTNTVTSNFVHSLSASSSNIGSVIEGILIETGRTVVANNIVSIGIGISSGYLIQGISDLCNASSNNYFYFNTVYIGGSVTTGATSPTYAIYKYSSTGVSNYRNNIFYNARSGGSSGYHYAICSNPNTATGWSVDYNLYFVSGSQGMLAHFGTADRQTLSLWAASTGQDSHSVNINPAFLNQGSTIPSDYKLSELIAGTAGTGIVNDFGGNSRNTIPAIGAWEYFLRKWKGTLSTDFGTAGNWTGGTIPSSGDDIIFDEAPLRNCILDMDRTIGDLVNSQSAYNFIVNGRALTINGITGLSGGSYIDATTSSSTVTFSGTSPVAIVSGLFLSNRAFNITIANTNGVSLESDFSVENSLVINSGNSLTVLPGRVLSVGGVLANNAGYSGLILLSDASGTASLFHNTDNVPATAGRYISGPAEAWHFLSSPVSDQEISGEWVPSGTYGNGTGYDLYIWDEQSECWIYKLNTTGGTNWNTLHPQSRFVPGKGYLYSVEELNPTKHFTGHLNNGTYNIPVTANGSDLTLKGINLIGNPYPSNIDWQSASGWNRSGLQPGGSGYDMWIWNPSANNYGVINSAGGTGTNGITRYIAPHQGFMVRSSSNSNIVISNSARANTVSGTWSKKGISGNTDQVNISVDSKDGAGFDEVQLLFGSEKETEGAIKIFSRVETAPSLYTTSGKESLTVRYLTDTISSPSVPVMFRPGTDGIFNLKVSYDKARFSTAMLEDREMNYMQDLSVNSNYQFTASVRDNPSRFIIHFIKPAELSAPGNEFNAGIYVAGGSLVIDLSELTTVSGLNVTDLYGRSVLKRELPGGSIYEMRLDASSQILFVTVSNPAGRITRKIAWIN